MAKKKPGPIVLISSYYPRLCGIATFCEEARGNLYKKQARKGKYWL